MTHTLLLTLAMKAALTLPTLGTYAAGDTITQRITVNASDPIRLIEFTIEYDSTKVRYIDAQPGDGKPGPPLDIISWDPWYPVIAGNANRTVNIDPGVLPTIPAGIDVEVAIIRWQARQAQCGRVWWNLFVDCDPSRQFTPTLVQLTTGTVCQVSWNWGTALVDCTSDVPVARKTWARVKSMWR